jgi:hypothetical protein
MSRYDLPDFEWRVIEPLLPNPGGINSDWCDSPNRLTCIDTSTWRPA